jgi:catechol 2,3-dioxygenase-like lactoylglutathione lyase family enzyme
MDPDETQGTSGELKFATVVFWTEDVGRQVAFFRDALGFRLSERTGDGVSYRSGETWAELHAQHPAPEEPEIEFLDQAVFRMPPPPLQGRPRCILAFLTDDIYKATDALEAKGATKTSEIIEDVWGWYTFFTDPDGNDLEVFQYRGEPWADV